MSYSFRYPPRLLHSMIEPQWLSRPAQERESSLDALERQEVARVEALRAAVLPEAPDPIGVAGSTDKMKQEVAPILNAAAESIDLMGSSCSPATLTSSASVSNFWHKYRQQFHDFQRDTAISDLEDSMIESAGDDHRTEQHLSTGERLSMGSHMSINSSGSSIANYAMDSSPAPFYQR